MAPRATGGGAPRQLAAAAWPKKFTSPVCQGRGRAGELRGRAGWRPRRAVGPGEFDPRLGCAPAGRPGPSARASGGVRYPLGVRDVHWIFGYGSLVWRPAFPYAERRPGHIFDFERRFWQRSTDHRGTPEAPGRVVTLVEAPGARCGGVGYRVDDRVMAEVLADLDHREKNGYRRVIAPLYLDGEGAEVERALVYIAGPDNPHYAGPAPVGEIAAVAARARGPSGENRDYVVELARALRRIGYRDTHVDAVAAAVDGR